MSDAPPIGSLIAGKYRVLAELGSGGMGSLLEAEHPVLKRTVAIKLVRGRSSAQAFRRLIHEAEAAQALHSEHVVRVFDVGYHEDAPYIVMERLDGSDLCSVLEDGPLAIEDAVDCVLEACVGISEAHALGIVHRDIKPANLFLTRGGGGQKRAVKVLDFGISKQIHLESDEADPASTLPNQMLGSPYFMSPEQLRNPRKVDARTDVWSLGVTLYNLLTDRHPFEGVAVSEVTAAVFTDPPDDIRQHRRDLPEELVSAILGCLEKRADERTSSVRAFADAIAPFAGKRGRLAAERVISSSEAAPEAPALRERAPRSAEVTATDAGLSATLPADPASEGAANAIATTHRTRASGRGWQIPALFGAAMGLAFGSWLFLRSKPTPSAGSSPSAPVSVAPTVAPRTNAAPPKPSPIAAPRAPLPEETPVRVSAKKKPSRVAEPPKKAPPTTSSAPAPAPPRVDIDGIPIVE